MHERSTGLDIANSAHRFTAWVAIVGALFAWANVATYLIVTGGDVAGMSDPAKALAMKSDAQQGFLLSMLFDSFGFYLPFLVVGGYFWARLRSRFGALIDMATLSIGCYVVLGVAGTSIQIAALPPLATAHGAGDAMGRAATEAAWLTVVSATQDGLWWMEGPLMAFWAIVTARALLTARARLGGGLLFAIGALYGIYFLVAALGLAMLAEVCELSVLALLPLWMLLTGLSLLRRPYPPLANPSLDLGRGEPPPRRAF